MFDSPDKSLDEHLHDLWPLGNQISERYGSDEILYYRPSILVSDSGEEEALKLPKRFDTAMAGTKRPRTASFEERPASMQKKIGQTEEERRANARIEMRQSKQTGKTVRGPPANESAKNSSDSEDDDSGDDDGRTKYQTSQEGAQATLVEACNEPANQVQVPVGKQVAKSLRDLKWKAMIATFSGVTMVANALGHQEDEAEAVYPSLPNEKEPEMPDLRGKYRSSSSGEYIEPARRLSKEKKAKRPTVEDGDDYDLPPTVKPSRAQAPQTVAPVISEKLRPVQPPSHHINKTSPPSDETLVKDYIASFTTRSEDKAICALRKKGYTVTSPSRKRSRSEQRDEIWPQALIEEEGVTRHLRPYASLACDDGRQGSR
ncbi:hypothetical protein E8E11_005080 [Didymella keratinophila]|nr:hypothetical protein E8E11_005080 [Didymella keratinophila]